MRDVNDLKGLHKVRTLHSVRKRSMPRIQTSGYLDLYMLSKEKERLLKETERLILRDTSIKKRLQEIDNEASKLHAAESAAKANEGGSSLKRVFTQGTGVRKEWKKMSLSY